MGTDPVTLATIVIAFATVINVGIAFFQWTAARKSAEVALRAFEVANRPYVGVESVGLVEDEAGKSALLILVFKNFGTAPAEHCDLGWDVYLNGVLQSGIAVPANTSILWPQLTTSLRGEMPKSYLDGLENGTLAMEIVARISYKWSVNREHSYKEKQRYDPSHGAFMNLGIVP